MRLQRIGCYDVTALLGEGGMGQVWQATDAQLGRQVALKILPDAFATDPDRLARFKREEPVEGMSTGDHRNPHISPDGRRFVRRRTGRICLRPALDEAHRRGLDVRRRELARMGRD